MKYALLTEVLGRWKAEIVESFLKSEGIDVVLVEDAVAQSAFANPFAPVQIFVPKENLEQARELAASLEDVLQNDEDNDEDDTGGEQ
jgi:hypothetical protein